MENINEKLLLSVIIPVYKVEEYVAQCIDSILKQTYSNIEIIIVDDGSPDQSGLICDNYAKTDSRIQVYHTDNGGLYKAQNYGLQYVKGDYIYFVDSDDYIDNPKAIEILLKEASFSNADIIVGNYYKDIDGKLVTTNAHGFTNQTDATAVDFRFKGFFSVGHLAYTWGKIYKSSFLFGNGLKMKPYIYALDKLFNIECYLKHPSYRFVSDIVYVYRYNSNSISNQYKKNFSDMWIDIAKENEQEMKISGSDNQYMDLIMFQLFFAVFFSSKQEYVEYGKSMKAVRKVLKKYADNELTHRLLKEVIRGKYIGAISSLMWKLMIWGFSFAFTLKMYRLLALGIKLLIDLNIDGKLSSTGQKKQEITT